MSIERETRQLKSAQGVYTIQEDARGTRKSKMKVENKMERIRRVQRKKKEAEISRRYEKQKEIKKV